MSNSSQPPHFLSEQELFELWLEDASLSDDIVMEVCLHENTACAQLMLRVILQREDLVVKSVSVQKTLPNLYGHSVRLDILAEDIAGRLYDIEIQLDSRAKDLIARSRAYSALLDMHRLEKGDDYKNLREHWVIFIVDRDIFAMNLPLYRIERCIFGDDEGQKPIRLFGDGAHIVFVNAERRNEDTPLSHLVHDIFCSDPKKMFYTELRDALGHHKIDDGGIMMKEAYSRWEQAMASIYQARGRDEGIAIGRDEGMAIGRDEGRNEVRRVFALNLLRDGLSLDLVARYTAMSLEEVQALAEELKQ